MYFSVGIMAEKCPFIATAKPGTRWLHFVFCFFFQKVIRKTKPKWSLFKVLKEALATAVIFIVL